MLELRLNAHDGVQIRALLARSVFNRVGCPVQLRTCVDMETCAIDWGAVERGSCDIVFPHPPDRRLEDRVLDVLRWMRAAAQLDAVDGGKIELYSGCQPRPDEFAIADLVRERGWA